MDFENYKVKNIYKPLYIDNDTKACNFYNSHLLNEKINDKFIRNYEEEAFSEVLNDFKQIQKEQGLIGNSWNNIKCLFGSGSRKIKKQIKQFRKGEISLEQLKESIDKYKKGQEMSVDVVGDIISGMVALGAVFASPFTGGASLLLAAGAGSGVKTFIKSTDAILSGRKYGVKDFCYDIVTGSINGAFAPVTNALGGAIGTGVAKILGLNTLKSAVFGTGVNTAGKGFLGRLLAKQGAQYIAKTGSKSGLKTVVAKAVTYGADMATDGSVSGAVDGFARSFASGDIKNMWTNIKQGFIGGLIAAPIIGGGFKLAGKAGAKIKNGFANQSPTPFGGRINTPDSPVKPNSPSGVTHGTSRVSGSTGTSDVNIDYKGIIKSVEGTDFADPQKFALRLENKIKTQFANTSVDEVRAIIKSLTDMGISENQAQEILSRITQFTSYSQMREFGKALEGLGVEDIFSKTKDVSLNNALSYIGIKKEQFFEAGKGLPLTGKKVFFLDSNGLDFIRKAIDKPELKVNQELISGLKSGKIVFASVDGWNVKSGNKYVSYGILGQEQSLADISKIVAERIKKGQSFENAINGDFSKEAKALLEQLRKTAGIEKEIPIEIIRNGSVAGKNSADAISQRIAGKMSDSIRIKAEIDAIINNLPADYSPEKREAARILLSQYYDRMISVYSSESIAKKLKLKHQTIMETVKKMGKSMDDVVYLLPTCDKDFAIKSFEGVCYQYGKINGIDSSKFIRCNGSEVPKNLQGKVCVLLDDFVGTGHSLVDQQFHYLDFINKIQNSLDTKIIFSPISSLKQGEKFVMGVMPSSRKGTDLFLPCDFIDYDKISKEIEKQYGKKGLNLLDKVLDMESRGYGHCGSAVGLPYMLPDNNAEVAGVILHDILSNSSSSKCDSLYKKLVPNFSKNKKYRPLIPPG